MSYQCGLLQAVLLDEGADVLAHGRVIMARVVGGLAVVAKVLHKI